MKYLIYYLSFAFEFMACEALLSWMVVVRAGTMEGIRKRLEFENKLTQIQVHYSPSYGAL